MLFLFLLDQLLLDQLEQAVLFVSQFLQFVTNIRLGEPGDGWRRSGFDLEGFHGWRWQTTFDFGGCFAAVLNGLADKVVVW